MKRWNECFLTLPSFVWLTLFFLIPTLIVFAFAFKPYDIYGGVKPGWTLETVSQLANIDFLVIFWRTLWVSVLTTLICLSLALPIGYYLARTTPKLRQFFLVLVVMPFWSSFLIRIFAWKSLLHPEGLLKKILVALHIVNPETLLLYNNGAVILVMVYSYLPFAILPIFASASKFNFQLLEAATDLGASKMQAFFKVFIPGITTGVLTALLMVFIPALGAYVIPDVVGGHNSEMIGNKIAQRIFIDRNLPQASAMSAFLAMILLIPMTIFALCSSRNEKNTITEARAKQ